MNLAADTCTKLQYEIIVFHEYKAKPSTGASNCDIIQINMVYIAGHGLYYELKLTPLQEPAAIAAA